MQSIVSGEIKKGKVMYVTDFKYVMLAYVTLLRPSQYLLNMYQWLLITTQTVWKVDV